VVDHRLVDWVASDSGLASPLGPDPLGGGLDILDGIHDSLFFAAALITAAPSAP
jgi:hypothetical protein